MIAEYSDARKNMVLGQIRTSKTSNLDLLNKILEIPREIFIPNDKKHMSYLDTHILLQDNRYIINTPTLCQMIELANIKDTDTILEIGCATGYSTAILSKIAVKVIAIEADHTLASKANHTIHSLGIDNTIIVSGNFADGHVEGKPYDVILINGVIEYIPDYLVDQVREGGIIVSIIKRDNLIGEIIVGKKHDDALHILSYEDVIIAGLSPLLTKEENQTFIL